MSLKGQLCEVNIADARLAQGSCEQEIDITVVL